MFDPQLAMTGNMKLMSGLFAAGLVIVHSCSWTQTDTDTLVGALFGGCIAGILIALICTVLSALPLCCGVMKPMGKMIATIAIILGLLCCLIPAITGFAVGASVVDKVCDRCGSCSESDKATLQGNVGAGGLVIAYVYAFGWVSLILGITSAALGCCICCKCCKMKDDEAQPAGGAVVVGQVTK